MKQKLFFLVLALFVLSVTSMNAQVRIGADIDPHPSSILDLSDVNGKRLGLLYPNVSLLTLSQFGLDGIPVDDEDTPEDEASAAVAAATGMMVFNTNEETGRGIYLWNGLEWTPIGIIIVNEDLAPPTYPLAGFELKRLQTTDVPAGGCTTIKTYNFTSTTVGKAPDYPVVKWSILSKDAGCSMFYPSSTSCVVYGSIVDSKITVRATSIENSEIYRDYEVTFVDPYAVADATVTVDGVTFLTYNLGANPTDYTTEFLSPSAYSAGPSTNPTGDEINGNLNGFYFQWGRVADGHQLWNSKNWPEPVLLDGDYDEYGQIISGYGAYGAFILSGTDWRLTNNTLWTTAKSTVDPCPNGFKVPTLATWNNTRGSSNAWNVAAPAASDAWDRPAGVAGAKYSVDNSLFLPFGSTRLNSTGLNQMETYNMPNYYWTTGRVSGSARTQAFNIQAARTVSAETQRGNGCMVRCVAE
jgi:uncharacterized protein (TIGR02145 family)